MNTFEKIKELKVKDVMDEKFVINGVKDTIIDVSRDITNLGASESIIVEGEGNVKGIVTLRDIVSAIGKGISPKEHIEIIMTKNVIVAYEDDPLEDALLKMAKYNISRLPVLNNKKEVIGVLGEKKLLKVIPALYELLQENLMEERQDISSQPSNEESITREGICENCEQYSEELINVDGKWLCKECYKEIYG